MWFSTLYHPEYIRWTVQTMKFLVVEPSPLPIPIPLGPKYSHQDPVFKLKHTSKNLTELMTVIMVNIMFLVVRNILWFQWENSCDTQKSKTSLRKVAICWSLETSSQRTTRGSIWTAAICHDYAFPCSSIPTRSMALNLSILFFFIIHYFTLYHPFF